MQEVCSVGISRICQTYRILKREQDMSERAFQKAALPSWVDYMMG